MIKKVITSSPKESMDLGFKFSKEISPGDIYALKGDLASGKTTFIKGVLEGFGYKDEVTSPTFTFINEYHASQKIIHVDCYREDSLEKWHEIGILDYFNNQNNIILIEWADIIESILPIDVKWIYFEHISEDKRKIIIK
tara:strand:- start:117 stop:533 length:417 start_codon:yes stop_codon:yes gene_type:complete